MARLVMCRICPWPGFPPPARSCRSNCASLLSRLSRKSLQQPEETCAATPDQGLPPSTLPSPCDPPPTAACWISLKDLHSVISCGNSCSGSSFRAPLADVILQFLQFNLITELLSKLSSTWSSSPERLSSGNLSLGSSCNSVFLAGNSSWHFPTGNSFLERFSENVFQHVGVPSPEAPASASSCCAKSFPWSFHDLFPSVLLGKLSPQGAAATGCWEAVLISRWAAPQSSSTAPAGPGLLGASRPLNGFIVHAFGSSNAMAWLTVAAVPLEHQVSLSQAVSCSSTAASLTIVEVS
jgi:hypothetical protein